MPGVSPDKLRVEVEAARSGGTDGNAAAGVRRRQLVSHLCHELSTQARLETQSMADWRALRAAIDPTAAIDRFLERIQQCGSRDEAAYVPNSQLGDAVATAVEMARLLAAWPQGLEALAEHQSCSLEALAEGEKGLGAQVGLLYPLSGAALSLDGARGLAALLYLRTTLTHVNLERIKLPPAGLSTLALALPASITTLLLAGTDCAAKGADLTTTPYASVTFPWYALGRQVHIRGAVVKVSAEETQQYWARRPRGSQLGAWASAQSRPIGSHAELMAQLTDVTRRFADSDPVPVPPHWGGYRIAVEVVEFWQGRENRIHNRIRVTPGPGDGTDRIERLQP